MVTSMMRLSAFQAIRSSLLLLLLSAISLEAISFLDDDSVHYTLKNGVWAQYAKTDREQGDESQHGETNMKYGRPIEADNTYTTTGRFQPNNNKLALADREFPQKWKKLGLQSASFSLADTYAKDGHFSSSSYRRYSNPPRGSCPPDCKCGLITGVTCYSPSSNALLPETFPRGIQVLTLYNYSNITNQLENLSQLQELSIFDGKLSRLPSLPKVLTHLRIINSNLKNLNNINNLPYLQSLNVAHNNVTEASLSELTHLLSLDLSHNPLARVPDLPQSLSFLNLRNTYLHKQPTTWDAYLPNLKKLVLVGVHMHQPPYLNLPNLEYLDLSHSTIKLLPYLAQLPRLKEINLSHLDIYTAIQNHFKGPTNLMKVDLSYTHLSKLPDKLFIHTPTLTEIQMHHTDIQYIKDYTLAGLYELETLILRDNRNLANMDDIAVITLKSLKTLNIRNTQIRALPFSLKDVNLTHLFADNVTIICDCHSHWLPSYLTSIKDRTKLTGLSPIKCSDGIERTHTQLEDHLLNQDCAAPDIISEPDVTLRRGAGKTALLECNSTGHPTPIIIWHSPDKKYYTYNRTEVLPWFSDKFKYMMHHITDGTTDPPIDPRIQPLKSGQLLIQNLTRADVGLYRCTAVNAVASVTSTTSLWLTTTELEAFKFETLLFGLACAMTFLLTTLIVQLIRYIMDRMGWECCCCRGRISSKAQQVKRLLESVESYKSQQLDRLKENYNSQVVTIKESCYQQMERLSESYSQQCKNLQSIKDYSAQQLTTARDQYVDQINRVRDYSVGQMNKVSENYVFQRQRVRKFSAHQLFKLRETYKYQQKTLNKILENIPDLYLQNCRTGGSCNRSDSMIFDDEIHGIDAYYRLDFLNPILTEGSEDFYYTPSSTLTATQRQYIVHQHRRQASNCSTSASTNDYHEAVQSWATNTPTVSPSESPFHPTQQFGDNSSPTNLLTALNKQKSSSSSSSHKRKHNPVKHTRSLSISSKSGSNVVAPTHRRTLSANVNSNVVVKIQRASPPLVETTYWTPQTGSPSSCADNANNRKFVMKSSDSDSSSDCETSSLFRSDDTRKLEAKLEEKFLQESHVDKPHYAKLCPKSSQVNPEAKTKDNRNLSLHEVELTFLGKNKVCAEPQREIPVVKTTSDSSRVSVVDSELLVKDTTDPESQVRDLNTVRDKLVKMCDDASDQSANISSVDSVNSEKTLESTRDGTRHKSLSREGSKEQEARRSLPPVSEDREPSTSDSQNSA